MPEPIALTRLIEALELELARAPGRPAGDILRERLPSILEAARRPLIDCERLERALVRAGWHRVLHAPSGAFGWQEPDEPREILELKVSKRRARDRARRARSDPRPRRRIPLGHFAS